jgi:hypothetical protein
MKKEVEIFDDENSIVINDEHTTNTFEFFPSEKKFKIDVSINDDYHHNYSTIEYKISDDPIDLKMRTIELFHRFIGGEEYSIKDGVVLESELKKNKFNDQERIDNLKKEVEWSEVSILGNPEINLYILSKHPEIISKEDYRKFLRQSIERIKLGVSKVENAVKNDTHGLQFHTGDYGISIWYPDNEAEKKESEEYWNLPKEKRDSSKYGKKLEYVEKFNDSIFKEDSPNYVGISDLEFRNNKEIVGYIENLLNKKESLSTKKEETTPQHNNQTNKTITVLIYLLTVFFIILKLTDSVDWNWFAVISPVLIWEGFGFLIGFLRGLAK